MNIKKLAVLIVVVLATFLLVAFIAARFLISPDKIARELVPRISTLLDREVKIADAGISYLPLGVHMSGITVANQAPFDHRPLAKIDRLNANVQILPLMLGKIKIKEINIDGWEMALIKDSVGAFNYDFASVNAQKDSIQKFDQPLCRHFRLSNGRLLFRNDSTGSRIVLGNITLSYDMRGERLSDIGGELKIDSVFVWSKFGSYLLNPDALDADWRGYYSDNRDSVAIRRCEWRVDKFEGRLDGAIRTVSTSPTFSLRLLSERTELADCEDSRIIEAIPFLNGLELKGEARIDVAYSGTGSAHSDKGLQGKVSITNFEGISEQKNMSMRFKMAEANFNDRTMSVYTESGFIGDSPATMRLTIDDYDFPTYSGEVSIATDLATVARMLGADTALTFSGSVTANLSGFVKPSSAEQGRVFGMMSIVDGAVSNSSANWSVSPLNCEIQFTGSDAQIQRFDMGVQTNQLELSGNIKEFPLIVAQGESRRRPRLEFSLYSDQFDFDTLATIGDQPNLISDTSSFVKALDWLVDLDLDGQIRVNSGRAFGVNFEELRARVTSVNRILYCDTLSVGAFGGDVYGDIVYDFTSLLDPDFEFDIHGEEVSTAMICERFTSLGEFASGEADLQINIRGRGLTAQMYLPGLSVRTQAILDDGKTTGLDFSRRFEEYFGLEAFQDRRVENMILSFEYSGQGLNLKQLDFESDDLEYSVSGTIAADQTVDLLISRKITKDDDRILQSNSEYQRLAPDDRPKWVNFRANGPFGNPAFSIVSVRQKD